MNGTLVKRQKPKRGRPRTFGRRRFVRAFINPDHAAALHELACFRQCPVTALIARAVELYLQAVADGSSGDVPQETAAIKHLSNARAEQEIRRLSRADRKP